ncbi:hypothetical protein [Dehalobacterium formicoaceticum]|uniref:Uncharacterized protein n=1 Tax=Dehalobacterium formicoaceticum TaxID=51515 RepID=A0ABT1Y7J8_9FIRM|nr:hypothetical protein [Dehalobacterium formicoaceticum]MCR6546862.1 hypothetical protein [Dehalobacterium formicoaceticum]
MKKFQKNLIMLAATLIFGAAIGLLVPTALADRTSGAKVDQELLKETIQVQFKSDMIKAYLEDYESKRMQELEKKYLQQYGREKMPEINPLTNKEKEIIVAALMESGIEETDFNQPGGVSTTPNNSQAVNGNEVHDPAIQQIIDQNRDLINPNDLNTGANIYNSLDTAYLFGLSKGGLTPEEKQEAQDYLNSMLSQQEYATAMELYMKYVKLLN